MLSTVPCSPVRRHQHLDVPSRIESVQLINQLQHRSLHLIIASSTVIESSATNSINLVKENDTSLLASCHLEQLSNHSRSLSDVLLDKLRSDNANECRVCPIGDRSGAERLTRARGAEEQHALGRIDTEINEPLRLSPKLSKVTSASMESAY